MPGFTPLYDWVMENKELTQSEAIIVCRVLRWGDNGCFESNATLGRKLKLDARTIQRAVKSLVHKEWVAVLYPKRQRRIIYVDPQRLNAGPLFRRMGVSIMKKIAAHKLKKEQFGIGILYLVKMKGHNFYKIGVTQGSPQRRLNNIQGTVPFELELLRSQRVYNCYEVERKIHERFSQYRMNGEWFELNESELSTVINEFENTPNKCEKTL